MHSLYKFIHSRIYKAPLQEIYSEAPPAQPRRYRSVLSNLQNALSLFLGRIRISKGSPFQEEGPTMENARRCVVAVLARGTNSWPVAEERRARRPGRPDTSLQSSQRCVYGCILLWPNTRNAYVITNQLSPIVQTPCPQ